MGDLREKACNRGRAYGHACGRGQLAGDVGIKPPFVAGRRRVSCVIHLVDKFSPSLKPSHQPSVLTQPGLFSREPDPLSDQTLESLLSLAFRGVIRLRRDAGRATIRWLHLASYELRKLRMKLATSTAR